MGSGPSIPDSSRRIAGKHKLLTSCSSILLPTDSSGGYGLGRLNAAPVNASFCVVRQETAASSSTAESLSRSSSTSTRIFEFEWNRLSSNPSARGSSIRF